MSDPATVPVVSQESFVPSAVMGWTIEEDRAFDAETIFEYLDGAGEVYVLTVDRIRKLVPIR